MAINQKSFISKLWDNLLLLIPLIVTQLLQRLEHVIDNRFMAQLPAPALTIHNIQYPFFLFGQMVGFGAATYSGSTQFYPQTKTVFYYLTNELSFSTRSSRQ